MNKYNTYNCIPISEIAHDFLIMKGSLFKNAIQDEPTYCFDPEPLKVLGTNLKVELPPDLFMAIPKAYDFPSFHFKFSKELFPIRKEIGNRLENQLTEKIKPKTRQDLIDIIASVLDCGTDYVRSVFEGKRSLRSEYLKVLEEKYGIVIGKVLNDVVPKIAGTLNKNVLKEIQKTMVKVGENDKIATDEIRRVLVHLNELFQNKSTKEIQKTCENLEECFLSIENKSE